jgi:hypothetical protein
MAAIQQMKVFCRECGVRGIRRCEALKAAIECCRMFRIEDIERK